MKYVVLDRENKSLFIVYGRKLLDEFFDSYDNPNDLSILSNNCTTADEIIHDEFQDNINYDEFFISLNDIISTNKLKKVEYIR